MEKAYLQWNLVNWITVVLMVALGGITIGLVSSGIKRFSGGSADA